MNKSKVPAPASAEMRVNGDELVKPELRASLTLLLFGRSLSSSASRSLARPLAMTPVTTAPISPTPPSTKPNNFAGQGALSVVGVFFTPRGYFNFTGGGAYAAASAQFWADQLNVNGGASLGLRPDSKFAVEAPLGSVALIR